jgi:hypothetical protein
MRLCMWVAGLGVVVNIGACVTSESIKLDWIPTSDWRLYIGQGCICWLGYDGGESPGLHMRGTDYIIGIGDGPSWCGEDVFGVEYVEVPLWVPGWIFALLAALAACGDRLWGRRLARRGLCPNCGYNLTGNVSGVCSECGRAVPDLRPPALVYNPPPSRPKTWKPRIFW